MELISVNVAIPRVVTSHGHSVETGIFKKPVEGPVKVKFLNLEGDRQADLSVHGGENKAVYAYSRKNIEYWKQFLGRADLGPGSFGENLTVDELLDSDVCIGDGLEIGTAKFMVTQPRFPCYKLGIALGRPEFVKTFDLSDRHGFYLRVLEEGTIEAGNEITLIQNSEKQKVSVEEFTRLYHQRNADGNEISSRDLARVLGLHALPESLKSRLKRFVAPRL